MPRLIAAQATWKSPRSEAVRELGRFTSLMPIAVLGYFGTMNFALFHPIAIPATGLDSATPFVPAFIVPYLSFFLLIVVPLLVMRRPQERRDAAFGFALIVVGSSLAFLFWPTIALTTTKNACPSMPAALALYCALCAQPHLKTAYARYGLWMWTLAVVVSPLLIKRDVVLDIAAGAAFGVLVYTALFFRPRAEPADSVAVLETFRIRNRLAQDVGQSLTELRRYNGRKRIAEFAAFLVLGVIGFSLSIWARPAQSTALLLAGILVTSVSLNAFPLLMHEGIHGVLFPNRRWNWFVSVLLGATFLMSFTSYRVMHFRHHRYLGDPRNPDDYRDHDRSRTMVWFRHFARLTFGPLLYVFMMPYLGLEYGSRTQRKLIGAEYAMLFVIYSAMLRVFPVRELSSSGLCPCW